MSEPLRRKIEAAPRPGTKGGIDWDSQASTCSETMRACLFILNKYRHEIDQPQMPSRRGGRHPKLDSAKIASIVKALKGGLGVGEICSLFKVGESTVYRIKNGWGPYKDLGL